MSIRCQKVSVLSFQASLTTVSFSRVRSPAGDRKKFVLDVYTYIYIASVTEREREMRAAAHVDKLPTFAWTSFELESLVGQNWVAGIWPA